MKKFREFVSESVADQARAKHAQELKNLSAERKKLIQQKLRGLDSSGKHITPDHPIHKRLKNLKDEINKHKSSAVIFTPTGWIKK